MEVELQYLYEGEQPPVVPTALAEMPLVGSDNLAITDTYLDSDRLDLRRARCSLRIRTADGDGRAHVTWKGPTRRSGSRKRRPEVELPIDGVPQDPAELEALLRRHGIDRLIAETCGKNGFELHEVGRLRCARSRHTYVQGLHRLELTWDRLEYPVGPGELRLEVEVKSRSAERHLADADRELRRLLGDDLRRPKRGKVRELCERLYPELLDA